MHRSSYERMQFLLEYYKPYWYKNETIKVLDIGSFDQNGTYRDLFVNNDKIFYTGLDMVPGPNVDIVHKDIYSWSEIEDNSFDLVITGQVFEHIEYPWVTIREIARILRPGGFLFLTAPNAGVEHKAPTDCYRYFADGLKALAKWGHLYVHHTSVAGIPQKEMKEAWINDWNDSFLVAQKEPVEIITLEDPFRYEMRWHSDGRVYVTYKDFDIAIQDIKKKAQGKQFILFGAGILGEQLVDKIGEDNIFCFGDNSRQKIGTKIRGKKVYSLEEIKPIADDYCVIVSAYKKVALEIKKQLSNENIEANLLYLED